MGMHEGLGRTVDEPATTQASVNHHKLLWDFAEAQWSGDPHAEAEALRPLARLRYKPTFTAGRSDFERFWPRIAFGLSDCWVWIGALSDLGYGITGRRLAGEIAAHRAAYRIFKGDIPEDLAVMHSCDVRCCVNPDHLSVGTHAENMRDMARKGRGKGGAVGGERNPMARLTCGGVAEIRSLKAAGVTQAEIARRLGVSPMTVSRIVRGEAWREQ